MNFESAAQDLLPAELAMEMVTLKVGNLPGMTDYYQRALGLETIAEAADGVRLGRAGTALVKLAPAEGLQLPSAGEAGLFHTALLFQSRSALAATLATAAQFDASLFVGSADHLVSEAFYFTDPEGNGIELYFDRPRDSWHWDGATVRMASNPLSPQSYLLENLDETALSGQREAQAAVGHVHLQVGEVARAEDFYVRTLGFEKTASIHDQALFVSAGGYHHHMAMNVWNSRGAGPRRDTLGLGEVRIALPGADDLGALQERLDHHGIANGNTGAELRFEDPWRNQIRVTVDSKLRSQH
ncbi:catechol 2,3-dioxygenase [Psychromicrobium silvestre]|uniref:Catechol 2,3-dioxygenase n=1 Tax=Psychromicrobium silvestre TaxID=1645614 RepID=A0A7Y9LS61_9MICC|nr:VOC family protein [Psychromicrobium silvestre]NYE94614.1 catechol 2,3-dioxygenase [Psychromicrobium silvestre]